MLTYIGGSDGFRFEKILDWVGLFFTNVGGCESEKSGQNITSMHCCYGIKKKNIKVH